MRLRCPGGLYTYPDLMVVCSVSLVLWTTTLKDIVDNPILVVEVLFKVNRSARPWI